jgi:hypothetical protein
MAGLSAPPAAAQTAAQVVPPHDGPRAAVVMNKSASVRRAADVIERVERQRAADEARAKAEQARADEAARVKLAQIEQYFTAAAAYDAERAAVALAAQHAAAQRAEAERAEAERAAARQTSSSVSGGFAALRNCESGGDYGAVNSSGTYRGAYQFSRTTWNSVAASSAPHLVGVDPASAAPADQDAMAQALYQRSGAGQWPHCGRHL